MKTLILTFTLCLSALAQDYTYQDGNTRTYGNVAGQNWFINTSSARYGWTDTFDVGDSYHIEISCPPSAAIVVTRWLNGTPASTNNFTCDSNGYWIYDGVVQSSEVGFWTESWVVDGDTWDLRELTIHTANWNGASPTVFFYDYTTNESQPSVVTVGDSYLFEWCGDPNGTVLKNGTFNGSTLMYPSPWQLDSSGCSFYTGTVLASEVGVWTESWTVNGAPPETLHFTVLDTP